MLTLTKEDQPIQQLVETFTTAWNLHDSEAFSRVFAEDADFTNVFAQKVHGRAAIENIHRRIFSSMFKDSILNTDEISVRPIGEKLAAVDVTWNMSGATDFSGNPWSGRKGLMNLVVKNENAAWSILIMYNMDLPALAR
jgi:uncharacterized protein (TIGR02246 family)